MYNTTYEARPSESPRNVVVSNITNSSMTVQWDDPVHMNGVLRYYVVHYNGQSKKVEEVKSVELTGLLSYQQYSVRVSACTVACSEETIPIEITTDIGVPEQLLPPTVRFVNSSQVRVLWPAPSYAAGPLNFYQIKGVDDELFVTTDLEALLSIPDCKADNDEKLYRFQVRAVNVKPNGEHLYGNWSEAGEGNCYNSGPSFTVMVIIWIIGIGCGIGFMYLLAYASRKAWKKYKNMQDVDITLPPGLATDMLPPDMKLLHKTDIKQRPLPPRPTSAASTGPESPISSLNSEESHMTNDTGNDQVPILDSEKMAMKASAPTAATAAANNDGNWNSSPHLRQRNVVTHPGNKPVLSVDARQKQDWGDVYGSTGKLLKNSNETLQTTTLSSSSGEITSSTKSSTTDSSDKFFPTLNGHGGGILLDNGQSPKMTPGKAPPYSALGMMPKIGFKTDDKLGVAVPYVQLGVRDSFTGVRISVL